MTLPRRAAYWMVTNPIGQLMLALPVFALLLLPMRWLGLGWAFSLLGAALAFVAGWAAARRYWRKNGYVPRL